MCLFENTHKHFISYDDQRRFFPLLRFANFLTWIIFNGGRRRARQKNIFTEIHAAIAALSCFYNLLVGKRISLSHFSPSSRIKIFNDFRDLRLRHEKLQISFLQSEWERAAKEMKFWGKFNIIQRYVTQFIWASSMTHIHTQMRIINGIFHF
jgi:hypothetical protein